MQQQQWVCSAQWRTEKDREGEAVEKMKRNSMKQLTNSLESVLHRARIFIVMCSFSLPLSQMFTAFNVDSKMCNTCSNRCATIKFCEYLSIHTDRDSLVFLWMKSFLKPIAVCIQFIVATAEQCKHAKKYAYAQCPR